MIRKVMAVYKWAQQLQGGLAVKKGEVLPVSLYRPVIAEVAVIARVAAGDLRSTTGANNRLILNQTGLNARTATSAQVCYELKKREEPMTEEEEPTCWSWLAFWRRGPGWLSRTSTPGWSTSRSATSARTSHTNLFTYYVTVSRRLTVEIQSYAIVKKYVLWNKMMSMP